MNKRSIIPFFLWMGCSFICSGQGKYMDSLLAVLKTQREDSNRVNTLNVLSRQSIRNYDIDAARKYMNEAAALAEKIKFKRGVRDASINRGNIYNAEANRFMGKGDYSAGLKSYLAALRIFEKLDYPYGIAFVNGNIGRLYWIQHDYTEAMKYDTKAIGIFRQTNDKNGVAWITNNIGLLYENQGNYAVAIQHYNDAIKMYNEAGNKSATINLYFNIGFLYDDQGKYPESLNNFQVALQISEETGSQSGMAASNSNMGDIYLKQKKYPEAIRAYEKALETYKAMEEPEGIASTYGNLAEVYISKGEFSKAREYLNEELSIAQKEGLVYLTKVSYEQLTRVDSLAGNPQGALDNYKLYILYRDSLEGSELNKKLLKTQMQYGFDKKEDSLRYRQALTNARLEKQILLSRQQQQDLLLKEKELVLLSSEKQMQRLKMQKDSAELTSHKAEAEKKQGQLLLLGKERDIQDLELGRQRQIKKYLLAGLLLLGVLSFFVYRNYRNRQQLKLQLLRNKIASDLHDDIGSTLSSISIFSQMAQQQSKEVVPLLEAIGENSRKMLDAMADIVWTIKPENDQFEGIVLRMRSFAFELLGAKKIDFEFIADDAVTKMKLPMHIRKNLYLIFKEATNNIVKYSNAGKAFFEMKGEKNGLTMLIRDNGSGFDLQQPTSGNGLKNMKRRAEEMHASFLLDSGPGRGTTIELKVAV